MEPRHRTTTFLLAIFLVLSSCLLVHAAKPDVKVNKFHNPPARLFFFDDTSSLIYHDSNEGDVYVSDNEGRTWNRATDIPKGDAMNVIAHPFNNRYAFVLGKETTHYRTDDRGKTWRTFKTPVTAAFTATPLSFHSTQSDYIIFHGNKCTKNPFGFGGFCIQETYYTTDSFSSEPKLLLSDTTRCQFAHSSKDFRHDAPSKLVFCVGFDSATSDGVHTLASSRLFASDDFFDKDSRILDLGIGKNARGVIALAIVSKYAVVALKDVNPNSNGEMLLYVSLDAKTWAKGQFPRSSSAKLFEDAYTIVESTTHSLAVDVLLHQRATIGTLFVSNSNGTEYVESLKDTNRNDMGYVDFENIYGIEGVGLANVVKNAREVEGRSLPKQLQSRITFDDGSSWSRLKPPSKDSDGKSISCDPSDADRCSLHLHSVTTPHNFGRIFSSPAPGLVMGVGSIGDFLLPYEECDTFLSTDAGVTWQMIKKDAHKYEFGDQGSVLVVVNDEDGIDFVSYSLDMGKTWDKVDVGIQFRARALTTVPDSTSQKFVLLAQIARKDQDGDGRFAMIHLDFSPTRKRQCKDGDFERWYARSHEHECVMGHKQWYKRRKPTEDCYVGIEYKDPIAEIENCACTDEDYECDYNYVRNGDECVPVGPEPIPAGVCSDPSGHYMGSSGFRLIPGNTCKGGKKKDEKIQKSCAQAAPAEGEITHHAFNFKAPIAQHSFFKNSNTILVRLNDNTVWQSSNEGYTWTQVHPGENFVAFYLHSYTSDRGYLITDSNKVFYTKDTGKTWNSFSAPSRPNTFGAQILHFHPNSDYLIWTGDADCDNNGPNCHAEAQYSTNNGGTWTLIEKYVRNCAWARDKQLKIDQTEVICESYRDKKGNQHYFPPTNALELIGGTSFYREKKKFFDRVVGFAKFSEFLIVAEFSTALQALDLQVSLDGKNFATGVFPPTLRPQNHAYTILESSTRAVFLHVTTSEFPDPFWGTILKSNGNGTYFGVSLENANRNDKGFVDFEKLINLDGIAVVNVVANPSEARLTGQKQLQTRITHNDGGSWKPLTPPKLDSDKREYSCRETKCALHIHGYTERLDARATYSSPAVPGLMMAVGNVGEALAPYTDSDTFLSRDAGFTWEEVHKDAHLWEFGDSGAVIVIVNDEEPTDHVLFTTNEGIDWRQYTFTQEKVRVRQIVTVPEDTSRKFILLGHSPRSTSEAIAIQLDFSSLTTKKCVLSVDDPGHDDFELWSPSEERKEQCLFGRQTLYHRRVRDRDCVVGDQEKAQEKTISNCACSEADFECEFNHVRDPTSGNCVLAEGASPLASDDEVCRTGEEFWYDRTAYRKIPYSSCEGGLTIHQGAEHRCPGLKGHGFFFWFFVLFVPIALASLVGYWIYRRAGMARGNIRLPDGRGLGFSSRSNFVDTLASVPWFIVGIAGIAWEKLVSLRLPFGAPRYRSRGGYRNVPVDEDAQVLRFEDEE